MEVEIISLETVKPFFPTPTHLRNYRISLLDEVGSPLYIPVVLFYSDHVPDMLEKLKTSMSKTLSDFYPFAGRLKGTSSIECSDEGAPFVEARSEVFLSEFLENPDAAFLHRLIPFSMSDFVSEREPLLGVKVTAFGCGGTAIGLCLSHKVADGSTAASLIDFWSRTCSGSEFKIPPRLDASAVFPPKDFNFPMPSGAITDEKAVTKRFQFGGTELSRLRKELWDMNPTRVEAVTALIWKAALEARPGQVPPSAATHVVNIRARTGLPEQTVGNLWQNSVAKLKETDKDGVELHVLADLLRKSIKRIELDNLRGENALAAACRIHLEVRELALKGVELYRFSSWTRFPFYEIDFGWGKPAWVCTTSVPMKNIIILMGTKSGDGIEAWVTLSEDVMAVFQSNPKLLQFLKS